MRWKPKPKPNIRNERTVKRFLLFPYTLKNLETNELETRWLERAAIRQKYLPKLAPCDYILRWKDVHWESQK